MLVRSELANESVIAGEVKLRTPQVAAPGAPPSQYTYVAVEADLALEWKVFVDLTLSACIAWTLINVLPHSVDFLAPSGRGLLCLVAILVLGALRLLIVVLWRRTNQSFDWKVSWILMLIFAFCFFVMLGPAVSGDASSEPFWSINVLDGWKNDTQGLSDYAVRIGALNPKIEKIPTVEDRQLGLQRLFSDNPSKPAGDVDLQTWFLNTDSTISFGAARFILTLLALPVGVVLLISSSRRVKSLLQQRMLGDMGSFYRMFEYTNVFVMPGLVALVWSSTIVSQLEWLGLIADAARASNLRRVLGVWYAIQQLWTLRATVQGHLAMGEPIVRTILSVDTRVSGRGLIIRQALIRLAKTPYVVAIEASALPVLQIGLLLAQHWFTDAIYLTSLLLIWPVTLILFFIPSLEYKTAV